MRLLARILFVAITGSFLAWAGSRPILVTNGIGLLTDSGTTVPLALLILDAALTLGLAASAAVGLVLLYRAGWR